LASVLIVEDQTETSDALAEILASEGHQTRVAHNGLDGLQQVATAIPDLILLDDEMPILDGRGMALALAIQRRGHPEIPIIVISGSPHIESIAQRVGTPHFLRKPFSIAAVLEAVDRALESIRR
jgi:CheY-like chemotaxis protein